VGEAHSAQPVTQTVAVTNLRDLGLWRSPQRPDLPDPATLVDPSWDGAEKREVEYYPSNGSRGRAYMGYSDCRICGEQNGSGEFTDGTYIWPEGLGHYVSAHGVRLPADFVSHALGQRRQIDEGPRDESWWLAAARPAE
jgi:hypothetical protein